MKCHVIATVTVVRLNAVDQHSDMLPDMVSERTYRRHGNGQIAQCTRTLPIGIRCMTSLPMNPIRKCCCSFDSSCTTQSLITVNNKAHILCVCVREQFAYYITVQYVLRRRPPHDVDGRIQRRGHRCRRSKWTRIANTNYYHAAVEWSALA